MITFLLVLLCSVYTSAAPGFPHCRCQPHQNCWPSHQEWSALNETIQGALVAVRPVAAVCHTGAYDEQACSAVRAEWSDSVWRAAEPGAVQWENWEAWPERNQSCYDLSARNTPCGQGRISLYSAKVQTAQQIQQTVLFAKKHNLRLVIKNSGHDFLGRSTAPESLQILTDGMNDIRLVDDFTPNGAPIGKSEGPAVTIAAGVNLMDLYEAVAQHDRTVIGGGAHTVGAAGGYIQGGGHSPFGAWKGLASDNALEFEAVTANGTLVTANAYQSPDLFWALRGGGGGTFGAVTSVTIRTFPEVPVVVASLNISTAVNNPRFWDAFTQFHAALPTLNDAGGSGYYVTVPNYPVNATAALSGMTTFLMFANNTNTSAIDQLYAPLQSALRQIPGVTTEYTSLAFPTMSSTIQTVFLKGRADSTGSVAMLASRLFSKDLLTSGDGPRRLTDAWRSIALGPGQSILGLVVAGGAVALNGQKVDSAVNPAWRKTVTHMLFSRGWGVNVSLAQQQAIVKNMTDVEIPILRSVEGADHMGAYMNEANAYEPGFQASFWGENYPRLYSLKQKWDPTGLFITRKGVGSEDWDDAGLCFLGRNRSDVIWE